MKYISHDIYYYPLDASFNQCELFKDPALLEMATNCCPHFIFSHDEILPSHFTIKWNLTSILLRFLKRIKFTIYSHVQISNPIAVIEKLKK